MTAAETLAAWVGAFVDELVRSGVRQVVLCPGSRSAPLALVLARRSDLRLWVQVDERSAGFFALGMAKAQRAPVALVCTSGTAAANFLPAVVEAHLSRVPLLVLTADRPPELRDIGAPQAIDQIRLYGGYVKWFADVALPDATPAMLRYIRTVAGRAVGTALAVPAGPVHLNLPFREPLVPAPVVSRQSSVVGGEGAGVRGQGSDDIQANVIQNSELRTQNSAYVAVSDSPRMVDAATLARLRAMLQPGRRGLILCGPGEEPGLAAAVTALAAQLGYPLLADALSGVRCGPAHNAWVLAGYDAFLRDPAWVAALEPEVVLRFGAMPTAKPLLLYLQAHPAAHTLVVDAAPGWRDPTALAAEMIYADPALLCTALLGDETTGAASSAATENTHSAFRIPHSAFRHTAWAQAWLEAERRTQATIVTHLAALERMAEGKVFAELAAALPTSTTLYVGNSMPIRDLDTFFPGGPRPIRILGNRGANGIDGIVSSALGASTAGGPLVLVIGDLSFYHDMNGLLAAKLHGLDATIVLLNNDGGGIFHFLPQAGERDVFEAVFGTPTGLDFAPAVAMYGGQMHRPTDWPTFRRALADSLATGGLNVIEVRTEREQNVADHRAIWPAVSAALADVVEAQR